MNTAKTIFVMGLICLMLFWAGCKQGQPVTQEAQEVKKVEAVKPVKEVKMEITPAWSGDYKISMSSHRSVGFEGPLKGDKDFKGGTTGSQMEMVFNQQIEDINEDGSAVARITIKELKYLNKVKDDVRIDFDSAADTQKTSPLSKLVGVSYTIVFTPDGKIAKVADTGEAKKLLQGQKTENQLAVRILSNESVKERHQLPLPGRQFVVADGARWSDTKTLEMGLMGKKSYERVYTVSGAENPDGEEVVINMEAIPGGEPEGEKVGMESFSKMFDNKEIYNGKIIYNSDNGYVKNWSETFEAEWVVVEPDAGTADKEPSAVKMKSEQAFKLEKLN